MFFTLWLVFIFQIQAQTCSYFQPLSNTNIAHTTNVTLGTNMLFDYSGLLIGSSGGRQGYISSPSSTNESITWMTASDSTCTSTGANGGSAARSVAFTSQYYLKGADPFSLRWSATQTVYADCSNAQGGDIGKGYSIYFSKGYLQAIVPGCQDVGGFCQDSTGTESFALVFNWATSCGSVQNWNNWVGFYSNVNPKGPNPLLLATSISGFLTPTTLSANTTYYNLLVWDGVSQVSFYMSTLPDYSNTLNAPHGPATPMLVYDDSKNGYAFMKLLNDTSATPPYSNDISIGSTANGCKDVDLTIKDVFLTQECGIPCVTTGCGEWLGGPNLGSSCATTPGDTTSRNCTCLLGKGIQSVGYQIISAVATVATVCADIDECSLYNCGTNAECSDDGAPLNERRCTCNPGWVISASSTTSFQGVAYVNGSTQWNDCLIRRDICVMNPCGAQNTCNQTTYNTRRCLCPPGFANQSNAYKGLDSNGLLYYTYEDLPLTNTGTIDCSYQMNMCQVPLYSCNGSDPERDVNGTCVSSSSPDTRNCTCPPGYNPPYITFSGANVGGDFAGCYDQSLCELYGCGNNQNVTCTVNSNQISRSCTCDTGYTGTNTNLVTNAPFQSCVVTNECETIGCGSDSVFCIPHFNSRTCYCPPGTIPEGNTSQTLSAGEPATLVCEDIDECALYGCPDDIGYNATCTTGNTTAEINTRTCTCVPPLVGSGVYVGDEPFPGCKVPGINIAGSETLGYTLGNGFWNDWSEILVFSTAGPSNPNPPPNFFATTSTNVIGWMESTMDNTTGTPQLIWTSHMNLEGVCNGPFPFVYVINSNTQQIPSFLCLNENGDLVIYELLPEGANQFQLTLAVPSAPPSSTLTGNASLLTKMTTPAYYIYGPQQTDVLIDQGQTLITFVPGTGDGGDIAETISSRLSVSYDYYPPPTGLSQVMTQAAMADFTGDGIPDLAFIRDNTFYWYSRSNPTPTSVQYTRVGWLTVTGSTPQTFIFMDYDLDGNLDMVALTSNCYSMFQISHLSQKQGKQTITPSFNGNCSDCGCGFSTNIVSADLNFDGQPDLVISLSGGSQILLNQGGNFSAQNILGGASVSAAVDMNMDGFLDILAITSGISVWYEVTPPLACADNVHTCNSNQSCITHDWKPPTCVCKVGFIANANGKCVDLDECTLPTPPCAQTCTNTIGSYICSCGSGYSLRADGSCIDIPECATKPCAGQCIELPGTFNCTCPAGYMPVLAPNKTGIPTDCGDIDECNTTLFGEPYGQCGLGTSKCTNYPGGYLCTCAAGYTPVSDIACTEEPCVWNNWDDWTNGACMVPQTRTRTIDTQSSGSPNYACMAESSTQYDLNITEFCFLSYKPPTNLLSAVPLISSTISDFLLDAIYPWPTQGNFPDFEGSFNYNNSWPLVNHPLRRFGAPSSTNKKRDILPGDPPPTTSGVFYYQTDFCDPEALANAAESIRDITAFLLGVNPNQVIISTDIKYTNFSIPDTWYNLSAVGPLFSNYSTVNLSQVPSIEVNLTGGNCTIFLDIRQAYDPSYLAVAVAVPVCVSFAIIATIIGAYYWKHREMKKALKVLESLPKIVSMHYRNYIRHPEDWEIIDVDPPSYRKLLTEPEDTAHVMDLFRKLDGYKIHVESIYAVYNPSLVTAMALTREKFENRVLHDAALFYAEKWKNDPGPRVTLKRRQWVKDVFIKRVAEFTWNHDLAVPIIPTIHGTAAAVAWKICHGGFATLSSLDIGFFGAGIYFTTSVKYAIPYFATKAQPAVIISYLVPGNPYPVIENPNREGSLAGEAIKVGYQSHYVLTTNRGMPFERIEYKNIFDEIVVDQESQVAPAYVLLLDNKGFPALIRDFEKRTSEDDSANEE